MGWWTNWILQSYFSSHLVVLEIQTRKIDTKICLLCNMIPFNIWNIMSFRIRRKKKKKKTCWSCTKSTSKLKQDRRIEFSWSNFPERTKDQTQLNLHKYKGKQKYQKRVQRWLHCKLYSVLRLPHVDRGGGSGSLNKQVAFAHLTSE